MILGCCDTIGSQAGDVARTAWLVAGLPDHVPGRDHRPAVRLLPAGGALRRPGRHVRHPGPRRRRRRAEHVARSRSPRRCWSASSTASPRRSPSRPAGWRGTATRRSRQFRSAEMIAEKWDISREEMEEFALASPPARRSARSTRAASSARSRRAAADASPPTSARARHLAGEDGRPRAAGARAAGSPPPSPPRSATRPRRC